MPLRSPFAQAQSYRLHETVTYRGTEFAANFGDPAGEYRRAAEDVALFDRSDRGLLIATGADRRSWLNNLLTNAVDALGDYAGVYAFACNPQGRILFDTNVLALPDAFWLDVDLDVLPQAAGQLNRYIIMDQVVLADASGPHVRCGVSGPRAGEIAGRLGVAEFARRAPLDWVNLPDGGGLLFRHDFAGGPGFELILPREVAGPWWDRLVGWGTAPAGFEVLDALRIEAGIPWLGRELDNTVLPAETGVGLRGVNFHKGCYIGQEIIERMRARGVVSRRLVKVRADAGDGLALPAPLMQAGREVGRLTSLVSHPVEAYRVGLAFVRTNLDDLEHLTVGTLKGEIAVIAEQSAGAAQTA